MQTITKNLRRTSSRQKRDQRVDKAVWGKHRRLQANEIQHYNLKNQRATSRLPTRTPTEVHSKTSILAYIHPNLTLTANKYYWNWGRTQAQSQTRSTITFHSSHWGTPTISSLPWGGSRIAAEAELLLQCSKMLSLRIRALWRILWIIIHRRPSQATKRQRLWIYHQKKECCPCQRPDQQIPQRIKSKKKEKQT